MGWKVNNFPRIPGYEIVAEIGSGSMGKVYLARQLSMDREVAVKVLSEELARDRKFTRRFLEEARAMGRLRHQNLVSALDAGCVDGVYYFVMDYVEGETLDRILARRGRLSPHEAFRIGAQIAAALEYAHTKGLVHRDVKPGNIIVDGDGVAKLCDMGLARPSGTFAAPKMEGTPNYMSPEQVSGKAKVDHRADIYSLGATLYRMVAGRPPFEGRTPHDIARKHLERPPKPLREIVPDLPREFAAVIEKMMAKRPQDRYQSMEEARRDMERVLGGETPSVLRSASLAGLLSTKGGVAAICGVAGFLILLFLLLAGGGETPPQTEPQKKRLPPWMKKTSEKTPQKKEPVAHSMESQPASQQQASEDEERRRDEAILAEAEKEVKELASRFAEPEALEELKVKLEALAARYGGTFAEGYIKKQIERVERLIERRDALRASRAALERAAALLKDGKFSEAMEALSGAVPARGMEARFGAMKERILQENRREAERLRERVRNLLKEGNVEEAEKEISDFEARSLPRFVSSLDGLRRLLEKAKKARQEQRVLAGLWKEFVVLVRSHRYQEAGRLVEEAASKVVSKAGVAHVERCRRLLEAVVSAVRRVREALLGARGQVVEYPTYAGRRIRGRILAVGADYVVFGVEKGGVEERLRVSLWEIDFAELFSICGGIEGGYWWESGVYLWHVGHPEQALSFMRKAASLGYEVDRALLKEVEECERVWWEQEAQRIIGRIEDLVRAGNGDGAAAVLGKALGNKRLGRVKAWQAKRDELRKSVRNALIEKFLARGIEGLLHGRIKRKGDRVEIEYRFSKEEYEDFEVVGGGAMRRIAGGTLVAGTLLHKVVFRGDVEVEIRATPRNTRPANIGILLKRGERGAYLGGLGLKPTGRASLRFRAPYRPRRAPKTVPLPANLILRLNRKLIDPQLMAYSLRPSISKRAYTIRFSHKGSTLTLSISGQTICRVEEVEKWDEAGQVGLWTGGGSFRINSMRIEGTPDGNWLKSLAASYVDQKYPFLKIPVKRRKK